MVTAMRQTLMLCCSPFQAIEGFSFLAIKCVFIRLGVLLPIFYELAYFESFLNMLPCAIWESILFCSLSLEHMWCSRDTCFERRLASDYLLPISIIFWALRSCFSLGTAEIRCRRCSLYDLTPNSPFKILLIVLGDEGSQRAAEEGGGEGGAGVGS